MKLLLLCAAVLLAASSSVVMAQEHHSGGEFASEHHEGAGETTEHHSGGVVEHHAEAVQYDEHGNPIHHDASAVMHHETVPAHHEVVTHEAPVHHEAVGAGAGAHHEPFHPFQHENAHIPVHSELASAPHGAHHEGVGMAHDPLAHTVADHSVKFGDGPKNTVGIIKRQIDSPLEDIQWASEEVVFVLTERGQVWRSEAAGKEFKSIMPTLPNDQGEATVKSMYISQVDSTHIFLLGTGSLNWRSDDMGKRWTHCGDGQRMDLRDVRLHPTQKSWMLAAVMSHGCTDHTSGEHCFKQLFYSHDLCASWTHVADYVVQFDWSPAVGMPDHDGKRVSDDLIYVTVHGEPQGAQHFGFWQKDINFVQSYDYFKSKPTILVPHGNRFLFGEHSYLFVAAVNPLHESEVELKISRDNETHKLFQSAILPVELTQHSYTILDTSEGSVFLHVNHQPFQENAPTGHVYISDWSGLLYSLSLPFNHRSADGKCDFEKVEGLEGIYLANFIDEAAEGEKTIDSEEAEEEASHATSDSDKMSHHRRQRAKAKTVITFDKGGLWSYLEPPKFDSNNDEVHCAGTCHLHLHGVTDTFGPFYSTKTATGLIMATGTIGSHLQSDSEINTYLSRDAGLTWAEVRKGSHIYEFGDHGALLVMADDSKLSNSVLYSWDSGHSWTELVISDTAFQIENIIIEPTATSQVFLVYGWHEGAGVLVYLNFGDLHERNCVGHESPDTANSDYEHWSPRGQPPSKCLMGHTVVYTRRKPFAACYNPDVFERITKYSNCECTVEDFECDYGYERKEQVNPDTGDKDLHAPCVPMATPPLHQDPTAHQACVKYQRITKGYRRVPGDTCTGGMEHLDADYLPCPSFLTSGSFGRFFLILVFLIMFSLCIVGVHQKYNICNPVLVQLRRWGLGGGRGPAYTPVGADGGAHGPDGPDDAQAYLNDEETGRSAELLGDGALSGSKKKSTKLSALSSSGAGTSSSSGSSAMSAADAALLDAAVIDEPKSDIKPLPPAKVADSVPTLAPPKADDEFNVRSKTN